jgi:YfiH family protein
MIRNSIGGLVYYQFESFPPERVLHGVFTRLGGVSGEPYGSLNLSISVPDHPDAVTENRRRFYQAMAVDRSQVARTIQVHGAHVAAVGPADVHRVQQAIDGLVTRTPDLPLVMAFADCAPIMLYDPVCEVVGIVHAGWRGTVAGVCQAAVAKMTQVYGSRPADIRAAIGPAIGPCCYEVGGDVTQAVARAFGTADSLLRPSPRGKGRLCFDQWAANELALRWAGVRQVERADICTACHVDEWYSHRAEGGRTGRFGAIIALRPAERGRA